MGSSKRRKHTSEFKAQLVLEVLSGKRSVPQIAREKRIKDSALYRWRAEALEKFPMLFELDAPRPGTDARIEELEQVIGRLTVENEALKKASSWLGRVSKPNA
jgi:transposase